MQLQKQETTQRICLWDWILVVGVVLSPMNEFRIGKVGPGEALVLLWCLRYVSGLFTLSLKEMLPRFWLTFLIVISLGTGFCVIFYPSESTPGGLATYLFFAFISCSIMTGLSERSSRQIRRMLYSIGILTALWYTYLYYYSLNISYYFHDAELWYRGVRFSGGANNPHQLATLMGSAIFLNIIHLADRDCSLMDRILPLICTGLCFYVSLQIKSSTLVVTTLVTFAAFLYYLSLKKLSTRSQKWIVTSVLVIVFSVLIGVFREKLFDYVFDFVESDANGLGRFEIFASIGDTLRKNWLFGLGPGNHGLDGTIEYHNAYLEILAMGGIIGFVFFFLFSVRLFSLLMTDPSILFAVIPLYAYGMGGFSMRRLSFWVVVSVAAAYSVRKKQEMAADSGAPAPEQAAGLPGNKRGLYLKT
ncbi:MAG: O-antigen ligase family protein [Oscillospiraceae bacterium]|nr:O-antigen ligase family protein [Oscillospiraceae bacterium]